MATAILRLWPDAQFAYGPPVENSFYYDLEMPNWKNNWPTTRRKLATEI
jgi:threonyl-tRNA synthetase